MEPAKIANLRFVATYRKGEGMKAGLLVPCYVDMFYPEVGIATVELLEKLKVDFEYPYDQTCCGQPVKSYRSSTSHAPQSEGLQKPGCAWGSYAVFRA
jgi:Fe-S oxidoreductase